MLFQGKLTRLFPAFSHPFLSIVQVKPLLEKWAAKDKEGNPCVGLIGPGGSGHYVKMVHNGIEQAHLSLLAELRSLLHFQLSLSNADVADIYDDWNNKGELSGNYLIMIGAKALRFKKGDGFEGKTEMKDGIVEGIEDKVTQDVDNSEGTGVWTCEGSSLLPTRCYSSEAYHTIAYNPSISPSRPLRYSSFTEIAARHCAAPAIAAAHQLRIISVRFTPAPSGFFSCANLSFCCGVGQPRRATGRRREDEGPSAEEWRRRRQGQGAHRDL
jgi:6-phosphogluconate dehydrogenase